MIGEFPTFTGGSDTIMKLFAIIFLSVGLLFAFIGLGWTYTMMSEASSYEFKEEWIGPLVFGGVGMLFAAIGGGILYSQAKQKARRELLLRTGRKLRAVISNVYFNTSISINNRHPLVVECIAEVSGKKQTFKSHNIWEQQTLEVGQEISVYLDSRDHTNYWVEIGE